MIALYFISFIVFGTLALVLLSAVLNKAPAKSMGFSINSINGKLTKYYLAVVSILSGIFLVFLSVGSLCLLVKLL